MTTMTMTIKMTMNMMTMKMIKMMMRMMTIDMMLSMMMMMMMMMVMMTRTPPTTTTTTTMIAVNSRISSFTTKQHMPKWDTCKQRGQYFRVLAARQLRLGSGWIAASSCAHGEASGRTMIGLDLHSVTFQALLCWEFSLFQIPSKLELSNLHPVCPCSAWGCLSCRCSSTLPFSMETPGCSYRHAASASMQRVGKG